jgi:predicted CoA-binding protein
MNSVGIGNLVLKLVLRSFNPPVCTHSHAQRCPHPSQHPARLPHPCRGGPVGRMAPAQLFRPAKYMQQHGWRIVPVNQGYAVQVDGNPGEVLGERCYAALTDIPFAVDMVDVFRREADVLPIAQQAIAIGAKCLCQQLGLANAEADASARAARRGLRLSPTAA